jgi:myo-inositol-1(or 4)-monophosphatase
MRPQIASATRELDVAREAAAAGGRIISRYFAEGVAMREKACGGLVSDADMESEHAIVAVIRRHFPDHAILGEESYKDDVDAPHLWVVDPLDGTNNFAHDIPHFAVSIAYFRDGRAECGVVRDPMRHDWFTAVRGAGAYHNDRPARVCGSPTLDQVLLGLGFYYDRGAMMEATLAATRELFRRGVHGIRRFGTASLDLCAVGVGRFGAFFEYELAPWDFAAGALFVEEAGGRVTDCTGETLPLASSPVLATNALLHEPMLEVVRAHAPVR